MRYEEATPEVVQLVDAIADKYFKELVNVKFKCVFDTKKKKSKGAFVFARVVKVNDFVMFLVTDDFDYVIIFDKNIWNAIQDIDKERIVRHELRHCFVDNEKDDPCRLVGHDMEDFYEEAELNKDDPKWAQRVATIAETIYSKDDEE